MTGAATEAAELAGRQAIVTGAASGIGKAVVALLSRRGCDVLAVDVSPDVTRIVGELTSGGGGDPRGGVAHGGVQARQVDLADSRELRRLASEVETWPDAAVLVNNAAAYPAGGLLACSPDEWHRVRHVNVVAALGDDGWGEDVRPPTLLGRGGHPYEVAEVIAFLASDRASFVTGATVAVDGGRRLSRRVDPLAHTVVPAHQVEEHR